MYPNPVRPLKSTAAPSSPRDPRATMAPPSDSLSYDAWIRDDWVRCGSSFRSATAADPAESPPGTTD